MRANELNTDAINFFKNNGLSKSKEIVKMSAHALVDCGDGSYFHINQLKRLVESWELVKRIGAIQDARNLLDQLRVNGIGFMTLGIQVNGRTAEFRKTQSELEQAIADVEKCQ